MPCSGSSRLDGPPMAGDEAIFAPTLTAIGRTPSLDRLSPLRVLCAGTNPTGRPAYGRRRPGVERNVRWWSNAEHPGP